MDALEVCDDSSYIASDFYDSDEWCFELLETNSKSSILQNFEQLIILSQV